MVFRGFQATAALFSAAFSTLKGALPKKWPKCTSCLESLFPAQRVATQQNFVKESIPTPATHWHPIYWNDD
jgi:hypothetical protein